MSITTIINEITKLVTSFTFWFPAAFIFGAMASIIWTSGNPEKRKEAGPRITWIIIGAFVLLSIGGILAILNQTFFASNATVTAPPGGGSQQTTPHVPTPGDTHLPAGPNP
jgi:hypothetical protein